jgi:hypothetical protein
MAVMYEKPGTHMTTLAKKSQRHIKAKDFHTHDTGTFVGGNGRDKPKATFLCGGYRKLAGPFVKSL